MNKKFFKIIKVILLMLYILSIFAPQKFLIFRYDRGVEQSGSSLGS